MSRTEYTAQTVTFTSYHYPIQLYTYSYTVGIYVCTTGTAFRLTVLARYNASKKGEVV